MEVAQLNSFSVQASYRQLAPRYDHELGVLWFRMRPITRPCFTPELLEEMSRLQCAFEQQARSDHLAGNSSGLRYLVLTSQVPGIFNLGGDLAAGRAAQSAAQARAR